jgi:ribosome-binding factor A
LKAVTVTGVEVSADLKNATVFVSVLGSEEDARQAMQGLESASGFLRRELGRCLNMRVTPELVFRYDRSYEQGLKIDTLLDTISAQSGPADEEDVE